MNKFKVGDIVTIRSDLRCDVWYGGIDVVEDMLDYCGNKAEIIEVLSDDGEYILKDCAWSWTDEMFEEGKEEKMENVIMFAKLRDGAIIPSKNEENAGYDIYACFNEDYIIIQPHETKMIPTGLCSAFSSDYVAILKERGSTGTKGMGQRAGVVDSGYRGEWFVPITNHNDRTIMIAKENVLDYSGGYIFSNTSHEMVGLDNYIVYPYEKAISQVIMVKVPKLSIKECTVDEIMAVSSERGTGCLGSSQK